VNFTGLGRELLSPLSMYCLGICLEGLRKVVSNYSKSRMCFGRNLNLELPEYKSETSLLELLCSLYSGIES
jgi:hypothetical protein